jgi:hypothetical protein
VQIFRHLNANAVQLKEFPFKRELSMAAYLVENEAVLTLDREVLSDVEIIGTEIAVREGRSSRGSDGRIDILATYAQEYFGLIELKSKTISRSDRRLNRAIRTYSQRTP